MVAGGTGQSRQPPHQPPPLLYLEEMDEDFVSREGGQRLKARSVPGCWFGMFRMLGYHQWRYTRRLGHTRKPKGRRGLGCYAAPRTISFAQDRGEMGQFPDTETDPFQVERPSTEADSVLENEPRGTRATAKASFTSAEISEEKIDELWVLRFPAHELRGLGSEWHNSIIMLKDKADVQTSKLKDSRGCFSSRNLGDGKHARFSEEYENEGKNTDSAKEVMEIFEINREMFTKIVQDPCVVIKKQLDDHQTSRRKAMFAKSRSFPVEDSSGVRYLKSSTLKHKQNEVWSHPKEGKRVAGQISDPAKVPIRNSTEVSQQSVTHGWNHMILNHFKGFKRRIRRALKDGRKERELSIKASGTADFSGDMIEDQQVGPSLTNDGQISDSKLRSFNRTSSLHESADKYARLFEATSAREVDLPYSRSLKLASDVRTVANESSVKTFRRRLSLPENLSFLFTEASFGTIRSSIYIRSDREAPADSAVGDKSMSDSVDFDSSSINPPQFTASSDFSETMEESGVASTDDETGAIFTYENLKNVEINMARGTESSLHERTSVPVSEEQHHSVSCPENLLPEEELLPENETACIDLYNPEASHAAYNISRDYEKDDAAFIYVLNVLTISGVFNNELESWYSEDQPLNPKLFQEVNTSTKPDTEKFPGNPEDDQSQLLFDLVNASLLEIYEQSASYFPEAFSFNRRVRSIPKGQHMVKEVWTRVNRLWGLRPELDQSLDDVMARDMATGGDGWLNCQWEGECVALELEDLVFDQLLDEALNSLFEFCSSWN
ncbi:hypothetical protein MLD38_025217 [Melastoma candidum]|uniref:Uncharacterized protein n=1 Tax=Melastoma candidum TaxID=119954 RepID=A0ACB9NV43_9MYRT|nr:hypothetical protein MLD38_025217 [Melastoma candidum]